MEEHSLCFFFPFLFKEKLLVEKRDSALSDDCFLSAADCKTSSKQ